jgi:hypothetical protein
MTTQAGRVRGVPGELRLGARPVAGEDSRCKCRHPLALHSNGKTPCMAFACSAGPSVGCGACGGTTRDTATGEPCETCGGTGSVSLPCQGFTPAVSGQAA